MPIIPVNLADVVAFENLPFGTYLGEIAKIEYREASKPGGFPQLQVQYTVIDGDALGKSQSEWLSFSPKAAFMMKRWFSKFGHGEIPDLDVDDDTNLLVDPDLVSVRVVFKVYPDPKQKDENGDPKVRT